MPDAPPAPRSLFNSRWVSIQVLLVCLGGHHASDATSAIQGCCRCIPSQSEVPRSGQQRSSYPEKFRGGKGENERTSCYSLHRRTVWLGEPARCVCVCVCVCVCAYYGTRSENSGSWTRIRASSHGGKKRGQTFIPERAGVEAGAKAAQEVAKATMVAARPSMVVESWMLVDFVPPCNSRTRHSPCNSRTRSNVKFPGVAGVRCSSDLLTPQATAMVSQYISSFLSLPRHASRLCSVSPGSQADTWRPPFSGLHRRGVHWRGHIAKNPLMSMGRAAAATCSTSRAHALKRTQPPCQIIDHAEYVAHTTSNPSLSTPQRCPRTWAFTDQGELFGTSRQFGLVKRSTT